MTLSYHHHYSARFVLPQVLRLNQVSLSKISVGQVLNLLANDVARFDEVKKMVGCFLSVFNTIAEVS